MQRVVALDDQVDIGGSQHLQAEVPVQLDMGAALPQAAPPPPADLSEVIAAAAAADRPDDWDALSGPDLIDQVKRLCRTAADKRQVKVLADDRDEAALRDLARSLVAQAKEVSSD